MYRTVQYTKRKKSDHNITSKLNRKENETTHECMGRVCIKAAECNYKEHDRRLKEQFINGIDYEETIKNYWPQKYTRNWQWTGTNVGPKSRSTKCRKKD